MTAPTVSVVVPTYNRGLYLQAALESVLSQTFQDFEIIVVDDGSTDQTATVAGQFGERIRYIYQENAGPSAARNKGVVEALAEYVALLDSDDLWLPNFLQTMLALAEAHPEAVGYYCWAQCMTVDGQPLPQMAGAQLFPSGRVYEELLQANFLIPSTMLLRRSALIAAGLFDPAFRRAEDWDLWLRLTRTQSFVGTSDCLVQYRLHADSLSASSVSMRQAIEALVAKHFGPDEGAPQQWTPHKRLAYGGLYRFGTIASVTKQGDWVTAAQFLEKAFQINSALYTDIDLFYELALGTQPLGYRGTPQNLDLENNAAHLIKLLDTIKLGGNHLPYATAYYALGLVAYNTRHFRLSSRYLWKAGSYRPALWVQRRFVSLIAKSLLR